MASYFGDLVGCVCSGSERPLLALNMKTTQAPYFEGLDIRRSGILLQAKRLLKKYRKCC